MRFELNARAGCYNLYCDTREEHEKMKQMLENLFTATNIKSIDSMIYADTDSVKAMKTKLNSEYGRMVMTNKDYIVIHENDKPAIIFKKYIVGVQKSDDGTAIIQTVVTRYYADDGYATVISQLI